MRKTMIAPTIAPNSGRDKNRRSGLTLRSRWSSPVALAVVMVRPHICCLG